MTKPVIIVFGLLCLCCAARGADAPARPNILFFFADDWARHAGCYADPKRPSPSDIVKTPNIDRLAREGVRFDNAFYSCPQCTPSRAAIVTGSYFWRCGSGAILQGGEWKKFPNPFDTMVRFPQLLADSGYATARAYKTLQFGPTLEKASIEGLNGYLRYGLHVSQGKTDAERQQRRDQVITQTRAALHQVLASCPADKPFFFVYGPVNTHRPFAAGSGKALWGIDPDSFQGKLPAFLPDVPDVREDMADAMGEVQALDLMIGIFREELEAAGRLDNTLFVATGDNGLPGFPRGKTQLYDLGMAAPLVMRWPGHIKPGRTVGDFVNLMDLAPTFLEVAGIKPPASMDARSLLPLLASEKSGVVDVSRDNAIFGRERHYATAREGNLPYPARGIRTKDFLYIRNFKPDRWPLGDPVGVTDIATPSYDLLHHDTDVAFRDLDASLTKAWMVTHRDDTEITPLFNLGFAKRPAEELYDIRKDPDQLHNLAGEAAFAEVKNALGERLMKVLRDTKDPRLEDAFDKPPYVELNPAETKPRRRQRAVGIDP